MRKTITITESLVVDAQPDEVWDFTQDYRRRPEWDPTVVSTELIESDPLRLRVELAGGVRCVFQYRQFQRATRASLAIIEVQSWWMAGGGGSWAYDPLSTGTRWTTTNTIVLRSGVVGRLLSPIMRYQARKSIRKAMLNAKYLMEDAKQPSMRTS